MPRAHLSSFLGAIAFILAACSSAGPAPTTAAASLTGGSVATVKSAALIESGSITEAGASTPSTYIQFFGNAPGASCAALDASNIETAGSLMILVDPSTLAGKTFTFGASPDPILTLNAVSSVDASIDDAGGDGGTTSTLVAVSGTVKFGGSGSLLTGTISAQMSLASSPGGDTVSVTGSFTAPACGSY